MLSTLAHVVRVFRTRNPGVRIDLHELPTTEQIAALLAGDLDVGFVRGAEADPPLHVELFAREPLLIALNGIIRLLLPRACRWPRSSRSRGSCSPRHRSTLHEQVMCLCRDAGFTPNVVQESREVYTTVGLVGAGVGVTIVPAAVQRMSWKGVVYKPIPRATVLLSMVRSSGSVRRSSKRFYTDARKAASRTPH